MEIKSNPFHVTSQIILNKFIEKKICRKYGLAVMLSVTMLTTSKDIYKVRPMLLFPPRLSKFTKLNPILKRLGSNIA